MKRVLVLVMLVFAFFGAAQNPLFQKYVGQHYRDFSEFEQFKDYDDYGGMLLNYQNNQDTTDAFAWYGKGDTNIVIFESAYNPDGGSSARYIFKDALIIEELSKNRSIVYGLCSYEGVDDAYIVALMNVRRNTEYFTKCKKAWRINPVTRVFEEIDPKKVKCINEGFGCC
jgi:hypothetical protein